MVTAPLAAVTITGKLAAELAADALLTADALVAGAELAAAATLLLADDPQPARTAAQAAAVPRTAVILRGVLIEGFTSSRNGREGRRDRWLALVGRPRLGHDGSPFPRGPMSSHVP
jgi:hypothetical protein